MALVNPHGEEKRLNPLLLSGEELQEEQQKAKGLRPVTMTSRASSALSMLGIGAFSP